MRLLTQPIDVNALEEQCKIIQAGFSLVRNVRREENRVIEMTPNEQLFADFFNKSYTRLVSEYNETNLLELEAYREKLVLMVTQAKAEVYSADEVIKEIRKKKGADKAPGFRTSLNQDEASTNALNTIKERQARLSGEARRKLSKNEKAQESLIKTFIKSGMTEQEAEAAASRMMKPSAIIAEVRKTESKSINPFAKDKPDNNLISNVPMNSESSEAKTSKPFNNPFKKGNNGSNPNS